MAWMSQERKKELAPKIKEVLAKYNLKGTISVEHHSTLCVNIKEGDLPPLEHRSVNHYHLNKENHGDWFEPLTELRDAMMVGNHDRSDSMSDYFDVGWYVSITVGRWNKPYTQRSI